MKLKYILLVVLAALAFGLAAQDSAIPAIAGGAYGGVLGPGPSSSIAGGAYGGVLGPGPDSSIVASKPTNSGDFRADPPAIAGGRVITGDV